MTADRKLWDYRNDARNSGKSIIESRGSLTPMTNSPLTGLWIARLLKKSQFCRRILSSPKHHNIPTSCGSHTLHKCTKSPELACCRLERIYNYLKAHPCKRYNPWIRLQQHPDQAQRVLGWLGQQSERAKEFEKGVQALRADSGELFGL